jgi:uncharacterized membrane protein
MFSAKLQFRDSGADTASESLPAKMNIPSLILGVVGFGVSLYALILHLQTKTSSASLTCDINEAVNCTKVIGGDYGEFMGLPLGALGLSLIHI